MTDEWTSTLACPPPPAHAAVCPFPHSWHMRHLGGVRWAGQDREQGWTAEDFIASLDGTPWHLVGVWVHATQAGRDVVVWVRRTDGPYGEMMRSRGQIWGALGPARDEVIAARAEHEGYLHWAGYRPRGARTRCVLAIRRLRHRMPSGRAYLRAGGR